MKTILGVSIVALCLFALIALLTGLVVTGIVVVELAADFRLPTIDEATLLLAAVGCLAALGATK